MVDMENWKRSVFFWTLALLFLITVPIVILTARGYRFDANRGVFVYSGTITFKSNPQSVEIKLNNESYSKKLNRINNSYNITGLIPGEYDIQISSPNFKSWSKKTQVRSGLASEFWNILLVRNEYEKTDLQKIGTEKFFISPQNDLIANTINSQKNLEVKISNLADNTIEDELIFSGWQFIDDSRKENIEWSPDNAFLSIPVKKIVEIENIKNDNKYLKKQEVISQTENLYNYFIFNLKNKTQINLNEYLGKKNIHNVRWDPKEKGYFFFLEEKSLYRASIENAGNLTLIASEVSSYDLSGSFVYYSKISNLLFKNSLDAKNEPTQLTSNFPGPENQSISNIVVYDESRISLILENKDFYIFNKGESSDYFRKLGERVEGSHFSDDGKKLLFWSNNEISVYFTRKQISQPIRNEDEIQNITRYSEPIKNIQWLKDYEHIIFNSGRWIKITEIDLRDRVNCMDVISTQIENPFIIYNNSLEKLYFTDSKEGKNSLYSIDFPEKTTLLGAVGIGQ